MTERAEILIVGAGASGGVVARRLARAGFDVVCLEQGHWHDLAEFPAPFANPSFYVDYGEAGPFSAEVGISECAG